MSTSRHGSSLTRRKRSTASWITYLSHLGPMRLQTRLFGIPKETTCTDAMLVDLLSEVADHNKTILQDYYGGYLYWQWIPSRGEADTVSFIYQPYLNTRKNAARLGEKALRLIRFPV